MSAAGLEREVAVDVDLSKLKYYNVAISDVIESIASENVNIPGGAIDVGSSKYLVRVDGEFDDPILIEDVVVTTVNGRPVYVCDIATVDFGFAERTSYAPPERITRGDSGCDQAFGPEHHRDLGVGAGGGSGHER